VKSTREILTTILDLSAHVSREEAETYLRETLFEVEESVRRVERARAKMA
jgi:hypothetical protein